MITKPDLLFRKEIVKVDEEKRLQLTSVIESKEQKQILSSPHEYSNEEVHKRFNTDLITHFSPNVGTFNPDRFPQDLSLDTLVGEFLNPKYSNFFIYYALSRAPTDLETIQFRHEILDELLQNRKKVTYLNEICDQLYNIARLIEERKKVKRKTFYPSVSEYKELLGIDVPILQQYVECIKAFATVLEGLTSKGLVLVYNYSKKLMEDDRFRFLSEQVDNFLNAKYIELGVTINALKNVRRAKFLDAEVHKLKRSTLRRIYARFHKPKWRIILNPGYFMSYTKLVAMAFDNLVEDSLEQIQSTTRLIGDIEFYTSAIKFYDILKENNIPVVKPKLIAKENRYHSITNMRNPMISFFDKKIFGRGIEIGDITPNSMHVDPQNNMFIVTGANNGGKTCYVTSIGLMYVLAQSGYHIPAEGAEISIIDNIYTHFVSPDDITKREGRWKNELRRIQPIWSKATPYSLCLIDDLGSGTNYEEAKDPILTIIHGFHKLNVTTFMNSHIHEIANVIEQGKFPGASNLQVEIIETERGIRYTYKVIPGKAGKSYAKEVASAMGVSEEGVDSLLEGRIKKGEIPKDMIR